MAKPKNIFITGITGFLASFLAIELLKKGHTIYGLARGNKQKSAKERVTDALMFADYDRYNPKWEKCVHVVEGNITEPDLGIKSWTERKSLANKIDEVFHSAALAELNCPYERIKKINVDGTKHVLDFGLECSKNKPHFKFHHISTMYIAGKGIDEFDETMYDEGQKFNNTYEQTKFEAEGIARQYLKEKGMFVSIFRPSMIMGESKKGRTANFKLIYQPLHFLANEIFDVFPANPNATQNLIHMNTSAEAISSISKRDEPGVYHIISPNNVKIGTFIYTAADFFGFTPPELIPSEKFDFRILTPIQNALVRAFLPYFNYDIRLFSSTSHVVEKGLFSSSEKVDKTLRRIYQYCHQKGFIKKRKK